MKVFLFLEVLEEGLPAEVLARLPAGVQTAIGNLETAWNALSSHDRRLKKYQLWKECLPDRSMGFPSVAEYEAWLISEGIE